MVKTSCYGLRKPLKSNFLTYCNYSLQEAKESFASPDYLFYGKSHIVNQLNRKNGCKKPFLLAFNTTTRGDGPKWNPAQIDAQTTLYLPRSHLSGFIQRIGRYLTTNKCRISKIPNYNSSWIGLVFISSISPSA